MYSPKEISNEDKVDQSEYPTFASENGAKALSNHSTETMVIETQDGSHINNSTVHQLEIETGTVPDSKMKVCRTLLHFMFGSLRLILICNYSFNLFYL